MAKTMRINDIDSTTNYAINKMKAKHLNKGVELTRPASLIAIAHEWVELEETPKEALFNNNTTYKIVVEFGKYLLSDDRKETLQKDADSALVYDSDIDNFLNRK